MVMKILFSIPSCNGPARSIQFFLDTMLNSLALLRTLGLNSSGWDAILIYMSVNKRYHQTRKERKQSLEIFEFLKTSFRTLETINDSHSTYQSTKFRNLY